MMGIDQPQEELLDYQVNPAKRVRTDSPLRRINVNKSSVLTALLVCTITGTALLNSCCPSSKTCRLGQEQATELPPQEHISIPIANIEISAKNYMHNLDLIRQIIGPDVKLCAVMKADAYGLGVENLAPYVVASEPDYIAAINNSEFWILRKEILKQKKDISLLRIAPVVRDELIESIENGLNIEEIIGSPGEAKMISETAGELSEKLGRNVTVNVHVNIETGIGRMAFRNTDEIREAIKLPHLKLKGAMTHFANAYEKEPAATEKTKKQTEIFDRVVAELNFDKSVIRHIANSAATVKYPWARKDMVRVGTLTYGAEIEGLDPDNEIRPVLIGYKSMVAIIEDNVPPGSPIGYDSLESTNSRYPSTTATVRVGYSDGLPEMAFKQGIKVLIRGQKFPLLGKTSMNLAVVDITDQDKNNPIQLGDEVVIIGKQGEEEISIEEFASQCNYVVTDMIIYLGSVTKRKVVE